MPSAASFSFLPLPALHSRNAASVTRCLPAIRTNAGYSCGIHGQVPTMANLLSIFKTFWRFKKQRTPSTGIATLPVACVLWHAGKRGSGGSWLFYFLAQSAQTLHSRSPGHAA
jgi:hypothetical protein